jgi:hypothetical protein
MRVELSLGVSFFIPPFVLARGDNIGLVVAVSVYFSFSPSALFRILFYPSYSSA